MLEFRMSLAAAVLVLCSATCVYAQDGPSVTKSDSVAARAAAAADEIVLDEILIEGTVEKPNVTILRNRLQSDFEDVGFVKRSFARELKALPGKAVLFDREFETVKRITNLKKLLQEILSGE